MTSIQLWTECESDRGMIVTSPRTSAYVWRHIELRPECNFPSKGGLNLSNIQWQANYDVMSNKGLTVTSRDLHCHKVKLRTTLDFCVFHPLHPALMSTELQGSLVRDAIDMIAADWYLLGVTSDLVRAQYCSNCKLFCKAGAAVHLLVLR